MINFKLLAVDDCAQARSPNARLGQNQKQFAIHPG